ncbi:MAG TPA: thiamine ABC transporter substrate-binding protein [Spirochaetia bacterium]
MLRRSFTVLLVAALAAATLSAEPRILRVLTHSSFNASPQVLAAFESANNVKLQFTAGGDAGETLNKAVLSRGAPLADVLYGVDNTFLSRALKADILDPYDSPALASIPKSLQLDPSHRMLPVDFGYVDLNYDRAWFAKKGIPVPSTLEDLTKPAYKGLLVVENPATSSPGLAFLLATIARFGEKGSSTWQSYWKALAANDVMVVNGWDDAYTNQFSAGGKGKRPIVVSYATSPAYELYNAPEPRPQEPPTGNILPERGSFLQVEFVGVLKGAKEPDLARRFVDFMLSVTFQADVPLQMWVYPASSAAAIPALFTRFAPVPATPAVVDPAAIESHREAWIREWTRIVLR